MNIKVVEEIALESYQRITQQFIREILEEWDAQQVIGCYPAFVLFCANKKWNEMARRN